MLKAELNRLLDFNKPQLLDLRQKDNVITTLEKNYQKTLLAFRENGIEGKDFTIFEFQTALQYFDERNASLKEQTEKLNKK